MHFKEAKDRQSAGCFKIDNQLDLLKLTISWIFQNRQLSNIEIFEHLCCIIGGRGRGAVVGGKFETSGAGNSLWGKVWCWKYQQEKTALKA